MNKLFEAVARTFGLVLKTEQPKGALESIDIDHEDGATEVVSPYGGIVGFSSDLYQLPVTEVELIKTYRTLSMTSDMDRALNEIRNEIFIFNVPDKKAIEIAFDESERNKLSKSLMDKIRQEYDTIYNLLEFQRKGLEIFDRWYIDGRLFLHKIVDKNKLKDGLQKVIHIDPLRIRRIVEYPQPNTDGVYDLNQIKLYYVFSDVSDVFGSKLSRCMIINKDAIAYSDSGIYEQDSGFPLSYLWKSIVPYNNMKMMEEALMVYRVVRSPERRVFYINVGNLSKSKAEQYIQELMAKFKNKLVYDSKTGRVIDRKNIISMVEDYWLPRRDDNKGTEIQSLPGATNLGSVDDVEIFKKKFAESTNIPPSRLREDTPAFTFGRSPEISRDEYRFKKFLDRLRNRFMTVFDDLLKTQLILKNIIVDSDWEDIRKCITWIYTEDNNMVQWKEAEILNSKIESVTAIDPFVGKYFTREWVLQNVMKISDDLVEDMLEDALEDAKKFAPPEESPIPGEPPAQIGMGTIPPEEEPEAVQPAEEEEPNQ
jgi:hypothetical protein